MRDNDFELELTSGAAAGEYVVRVVRSLSGVEPRGVATLDMADLLGRRQGLERTVLLSSVKARGGLVSETEQPLRDIGQHLFQSVFTGPIAEAYRSSAAVARARRGRLRIVLRLTAPELGVLPWESLFDSSEDGYVCLREPLVRHVASSRPEEALPVQLPLRILGVIASPLGTAPLDVVSEQQRLEAAIAAPRAAGRVTIDWLIDATWDSLQSQLLDGPWHVVHFIGHGSYDTERDEGRLALVDPTGRANWVPAGRFVDLIDQAEPSPRLVVLNSCESGQGGTRDLFSGIAAMLVHRGVSAVAAMQFSVTDDAALAFPRGFYGALTAGRSVDEAVRSGRVAMLGGPTESLEWVTPVLYVRGNALQLFEIDDRAASSIPAVPQQRIRSATAAEIELPAQPDASPPPLPPRDPTTGSLAARALPALVAVTAAVAPAILGTVAWQMRHKGLPTTESFPSLATDGELLAAIAAASGAAVAAASRRYVREGCALAVGGSAILFLFGLQMFTSRLWNPHSNELRVGAWVYFPLVLVLVTAAVALAATRGGWTRSTDAVGWRNAWLPLASVGIGIALYLSIEVINAKKGTLVPQLTTDRDVLPLGAAVLTILITRFAPLTPTVRWAGFAGLWSPLLVRKAFWKPTFGWGPAYTTHFLLLCAFCAVAVAIDSPPRFRRSLTP